MPIGSNGGYPITAECSRLIKLPSTMVYGKSSELNTLDLG